MRARMPNSFQNFRFHNDCKVKAFKTQLFFNQKPSIVHRARACEIIRKPIRFNIPVPGGHAGRSRARAHVELVSCTNQYQIIPCGPHARADVGLLQKVVCSQRFQHKDIEKLMVFFTRQALIARALADS